MLNKNEGVSMPFLTLVIILLVIAAIISLVFSFLGILLVGALRLLPIVVIVLLVLVLMGKVRISITRGDGRRNRWFED